MLRFGMRYKEVIFGAVFGVGGALIDAAMHDTMGNRSLLAELFHPTPVMAAYRILFLVLGIGLGVLLWLRNRTERDFRKLSASFDALRRDITAPSMLVHTNLQVLLMKDELGLSKNGVTLVRTAYESSIVIQHILNDMPGR